LLCLLLSQTIAKKIANLISKSFFIYKIIVVYSLIVARIAKINIIVTILVVANKFKSLNRKYAINY